MKLPPDGFTGPGGGCGDSDVGGETRSARACNGSGAAFLGPLRAPVRGALHYGFRSLLSVPDPLAPGVPQEGSPSACAAFGLR